MKLEETLLATQLDFQSGNLIRSRNFETVDAPLQQDRLRLPAPAAGR